VRPLTSAHFIIAQASITSIPGDLHEPAPSSAALAASPVQLPPAASSRPADTRPPTQPSQSRPKRAEGEGEHPESEDDHEPFDYQRHRGANGRKGPDGAAPPTSNGNGTGSPLTRAALESWNKGSGAGSGGDVARWQGQGPVPGKPSAPGQPGGPKPEDEGQTAAGREVDRQREWCLCRRPDSWAEMIRCDMPTCTIQWVSVY
jgi:hypothetical protein